MKKTIIGAFLSLMLFASCNSWLTVEPANRIDRDKLFSDESGFQNALNGIYQLLAEPSLYGRHLSWGAISAVSKQYDVQYITGYEEWYFSQFEYETTQTQPIIEGIWSGLYNAIANCNLLIREVSEVSPSLFVLDTIARNVIWGEALALRALCHFDVIRLFAPAPVKNDQKIQIPYQTIYPSTYEKSYNAAEGMDLVIEDLLKAKEMLAYHDTIHNTNQMAYFFNRYTIPSGFYNNRGYRLNYCAVVGLLARAYLYKGDMEHAVRYASEIYEVFLKKKKWFKFNPSYDFSNTLMYRQKKHMEDCLFAFYNEQLLENVETYYRQSATLNILDVEGIFKNDEDDYRLYLINADGNKYTYSIKYREVDNYQRDWYEGRAIPVIRLSEIYHILIEAYYDTRPEESLRLLNEFRTARGCKRILSSIAGKETLYELLINDARREFIGEGQLLYYYKRLNKGIKVTDGEIEPQESILTFDIPDSQYVN